MNKHKRAQALVISLWILVILTTLAISIGHRVSLALRLSRYQRDKLKAFCLAKAGINRAIAQLEKDNNTYDALNEPWADNEGAFKKIILDEAQGEFVFATVSYTIIDENNEPHVVYGAQDEAGKLNINIASKEIIIALLEKFEIGPAQDIAENIRIWRGDTEDIPGLEEKKKNYEDLGYPCKADKFSNVEELVLVKDINPGDLQKMKELITVYTDKVNINTTSKDALTILANSVANSDEKNSVAGFVNTIIELRNNQPNKAFESVDITVGGVGSEYQNLFNKLKPNLTVESDNFLIEVTGNAGKIKSRIQAIYSRKEKKFLYWHEN